MVVFDRSTAVDSFSEWLYAKYRPVSGADGEDDPDPNADPAPGGTGDGDPDPGSGDPAPEDDPDPPSESDPEGTLEIEQRYKDQIREYQGKLARAEAAAAQAKKDAAEARRSKAQQTGNWEQVAKERESELKDAVERADSAEARAVTAEQNLDNFQREVRVTRIAGRFGFHDPRDALAQLSDEDTGDDKTCERALRKLAQDKPYLVDPRRARGRAMGSGASGGQVLLTRDQMSSMTPDEINEKWELVQASAIALGNGGG